MKSILVTAIVGFFSVTAGYAQLCKHIKPGMSKAEVIKEMGKQDSIQTLTGANGTDSIVIWYYGGQQAMLSNGIVDKVVADPGKENELSKQYMDGKLNTDDFEKQMEELNQNSCK